VLLWVAASQVALWTIGAVLSKRWSRGDETSDEFRIVTIGGGRRFASRAVLLRAGAVDATMGGVDLDLRGATLDPAGATLDVTTTMGGVHVTVPDHWAVEITQQATAGGVDATVARPEDLPASAPVLHVRATARLGGIAISSAA
jgi:hypothetical protein